MQVTQIITAHGWHAHFEDGTSTPVIAWGLQHESRVAAVIPVCVRADGSSYNPTQEKGFAQLSLKAQNGLKETTSKTAKRVSSDESNGTASARPSK